MPIEEPMDGRNMSHAHYFVDPIYKYIGVTEEELEIMHSPDIRRLHYVKQKGLSYLFFPGARHTRMDHTLGVLYLCNRIGKRCGLNAEELRLLRLSALFHDIGHGPHSHLTESILWRNGWDVTHETISAMIVKERFSGILSDDDTEAISNIILGNHPDKRLSNILSGTIDADRIDYVFRDIYNAGLPYRIGSLDPLLNAIRIDEEGTSVDLDSYFDFIEVEPLLVMRDYMKWYIDKDPRCRSLNSLVIKAVDSVARSNSGNYFKGILRAKRVEKLDDLPNFVRLTDYEFLREFRNGSDLSKQVSDMISRGKCYECICHEFIEKIEPAYRSKIATLIKKKIEKAPARAKLEIEIEEHLEKKCDIFKPPMKSVLVDIPHFKTPSIEEEIPKLYITYPEFDKITLPEFDILVPKPARKRVAYQEMTVVKDLLKRTERVPICVFCRDDLSLPAKRTIPATFESLLRSKNNVMDDILGGI